MGLWGYQLVQHVTHASIALNLDPDGDLDVENHVL